MDKLISWSWQHSKDKCSKCGMKKSIASKKGCCKDVQKQLKLQNDQKVTEAAVKLIHLSSLPAPVGYQAFQPEPLTSIPQQFPVSHGPPLKAGAPIYLINCVFRI
jgi:hypothetical protein